MTGGKICCLVAFAVLADAAVAVPRPAGDDAAAVAEAAVLRDMRKDVTALHLKVGYPGAFLSAPDSVSALRTQKYVRRDVRPVCANGLYDLGEESVGYVEARASKRPVLRVGESVAEAMNENEADFEQSTEMRERAPGIWRTPLPLAFRYFRFRGEQPEAVLFREEVADVRDGLVFRGTPRETRIRDVALRTLRLCMRDFLIDGVKRDRLPWSGDLSVSLLANAYSFRDAGIVRRTLRVLDSAGWEAGDVNGFIDYSLWLVISHELFQRHFGDLAFLKETYGRIAGRLDSIVERADADGLLRLHGEGGKRTGLFIDWTDDSRSTTALNAIYCGALAAGAALADRVGERADSLRWTERAVAVRQALREKAWDAKRGLFRPDVDDIRPDHLTRHPNIYAAYFGLVSGAELESIGCALAADDLPPVGTPYVSSYEAMSLLKCGRSADARRLVERIWGTMLDLGATTFWEGYDPKAKGDEHLRFYGRPYGKSLCHAWSAAPAFLLPMIHEYE